MGSTLMPPPPAATDAEKRTRERANAMVMLSTMFALSDDQLALVMTAAGSLPVGKRGVFPGARRRPAATAWSSLHRRRSRRRNPGRSDGINPIGGIARGGNCT